jgi:ParB-like chromosome segregation protein Spo0J
MHRLIPLCQLFASRTNPRRVRPERDAHRRLVASIRAYGLLEPLVVRPAPRKLAEGGSEDGALPRYEVVAGRRRLDALRTIHRRTPLETLKVFPGAGASGGVPCMIHDVDAETAHGMALSENFAREGMHPLDEAEAFARLAHVDAKGVAAIAADFGVTARYVRQRMKLAGLADGVKVAFRAGEIDTATAEVFATVSAERQAEVWGEVDGKVHHARHAQNLIASGWIDAAHARFDVDSLPVGAVSSDLFGDRVRIERRVFMEKQAEALVVERDKLLDDGWAEVVIAPRDEVQDRLYVMSPAPVGFDDSTQARLETLSAEREALDRQLEGLGEDATDVEAEALYEKLDRLDERVEQIEAEAVPHHDEETKAVGTMFLIVGSDGSVDTQARMPRGSGSHEGSGGKSGQVPGTGASRPVPELGTDRLSDKQVRAALAHEVVAVRSALSVDDARADRTRRVVLALLLHRAVSASPALLVRRDADPIDRFFAFDPAPAPGNHGSPDTAGQDQPHPSIVFTPWAKTIARRDVLDPLLGKLWVDEAEAYRTINQLDDRRLDALIESLTVAAVSGSLAGRSPLMALLAADLEVDVRASWTPDAEWFKGYRKLQLARLLGELRGPAHGSAAERRKKSELVEELASLFKEADAGRMTDADLSARVNAWTPACLTDSDETTEAEPDDDAAGHVNNADATSRGGDTPAIAA